MWFFGVLIYYSIYSYDFIIEFFVCFLFLGVMGEIVMISLFWI